MLVGCQDSQATLCRLVLGFRAAQLGGCRLLRLARERAAFECRLESGLRRAQLFFRRCDRGLRLIECDDGTVTPFAGVGYDGEVLNDYVALKKAVKGPVGHYLVQTVWGYLGAMITRTVPRHMKGPAHSLKVTTKTDAILMRASEHGDEEVVIPAGTVLWDGPAGFLSVGTIPFFGFGFTMFPFAGQRPRMMQLRVCATPIPKILANLFPGIWKGRFRDDDLEKLTHDHSLVDEMVRAGKLTPGERIVFVRTLVSEQKKADSRSIEQIQTVGRVTG